MAASLHGPETEERFQQGSVRALWEHHNEIKWTKSTDDERQYVLDAFHDLTIEDAENVANEEADEVEKGSRARSKRQPASRRVRYDSDVSADDSPSPPRCLYDSSNPTDMAQDEAVKRFSNLRLRDYEARSSAPRLGKPLRNNGHASTANAGAARIH
ncbi:MAG: hypothetical protein LQ337_003661 [Flavoplaca oasis]|nr:MAG: hypothetical protein LQ337_003661 [Flavoplaca oasis]